MPRLYFFPVACFVFSVGDGVRHNSRCLPVARLAPFLMGHKRSWKPAACEFCNETSSSRLPPSSAADRYAVLFRGEAYRWGCDARGMQLQQLAFASQLSNIVEPLAKTGRTVKVFLTVDDWRTCRSNTTTLYNASTAISRLVGAVAPAQLATLTSFPGVRDQPDGIMKALKEYLPSSLAFEFLIITRYDVRLLTPITSWACYGDRDRISAASKCEPSAWDRFNCVADHLWIVPRPYVRPFTKVVGARLNLSHFTKCCYSKRCLHKAGHGCYNVLAHVLTPAAVGFCWPQPARSVAEPNANYQCCAHGTARVSLTSLAQMIATGATGKATGRDATSADTGAGPYAVAASVPMGKSMGEDD